MGRDGRFAGGTAVLAFALAVAVLLVASISGSGLAQEEQQFVRGEPDLDVHVPDPTLSPGSTVELTLQVSNEGEVSSGATTQRELVTTARNVRIEVDEDDAPITVETRRQSVGPIADGDVREVPITVTVPEDAEPGEYSIDVELDYAHTSLFAPRSGVIQERTRSVTRSVDVVIDDGPRFALRSVESDVAVGDAGTLLVEVENVGEAPATALRVLLESTSGNVVLGDGPADTARIDALEPGEVATVEYEAIVREGAPARGYSLDGTVGFTDADGVDGVQEGLSVGIEPAAEQTFTLSVDETTLRLGETGTIVGTVRNDGPADVEDVVLALGDGQFEPRSPTYAVGDLAAGEADTFRFRAVVPPGADAVPQRIDVTTAYRTAAGNDRTTTDPVRVPVADRRDAVTVRAVDPTFAAGESGTLVLELRNQLDVEIRDVRVTLVAEDPLETEFRTTVVPALSPDESDRVAFDLEVDGDAPISSYPALVEINYTDADDEPASARPATVAVEVTETDDDIFDAVEIVIFVVMLALVVAAFVWLYRR